MRRIICLALVFFSLLPLLACAAGADEGKAAAAEETAELLVINVGKGDALLLRAGEKAWLIDAGKRIRWGKLAAALRENGITRLNGVFLTHTDADHAGGLLPLALSDIEVETWYASAYYSSPKKEKKHPAVIAAAVRGQEVVFLEAGDTAEGLFTVLAPFEESENEDDNSLVLRTKINGVSLLLAGDMELGEEEMLLSSGADLSCTVLKVPNHGDNDACSDALIARTGVKIALISTDPEEKPGTPDMDLIDALDEAGADIYRTDFSGGGIRVTLFEGEAEADYFDAPEDTGRFACALTVSDTEEEWIFLTNTDTADADLTDFYFITDRDGNIFLFPQGTILPAGKTLSIGTLSCPEETDLIWKEENVLSNKKSDGLILYTAGGNVAAEWYSD